MSYYKSMKTRNYTGIAFFDAKNPNDNMIVGPFPASNNAEAKQAVIKILKQRGVYALVVDITVTYTHFEDAVKADEFEEEY